MFALIGEVMVAEMRAARADLYARTKFTAEGEPITETRTFIESLLSGEDPDERAAVTGTTGKSFAAAAESGLIDVG